MEWNTDEYNLLVRVIDELMRVHELSMDDLAYRDLVTEKLQELLLKMESDLFGDLGGSNE